MNIMAYLIIISSIYIILIINRYVVSGFGVCKLNLRNDISHEHPLILNPFTDEFLYPDDSNGFTFFECTIIKLVCSGEDNSFQNPTIETKEIIAMCIDGQVYSVFDRFYTFKQLKCKKIPESRSRQIGTCLSDRTEIEIGFDISEGFVKLITLCFDNENKNTIYSHFTLTNKIGSQHTHVHRPVQFNDDFYRDRFQMMSMYSRANQIEVVMGILNSDSLAQQFIQSNNDKLFSRGHLAAKSDFVYAAQQLATFFLVNVAPQWKSFNSGNWNSLEIACRTFVQRYPRELDVYTGTYGVLTLPDTQNNEQEIYLYARRTIKAIAVPLLFWKVLYDNENKAGIAFVGSNNIHYSKPKICTDICNKLNWRNLLAWEKDNIFFGESYCCTVDDLRRVVPDVPSFEVVNVLQ